MSDNPFSAPVHSPQGSAPIPAGKRIPGGIIAVAIICLILGALNSLLGCCGLGAMVMGPQLAEMAPQEPENPIPVNQAAAQAQVSPVGVALRTVVSLSAISMLIGSIFTLTGKDWGRRLLAMSLLVAALAGGIETGMMMVEGMGDVQQELNNNPKIAEMPEDQKKIAIVAAQVMFYAMGAFFAATVIFYLFAWRYVGAEKHRPYFT